MFMSREPKGRRLCAAAQWTFVAFAVAGLLLSGPQPVKGQSHTVTKIKHYVVNGTTAASLDQQMIARGPIHGRARAYANIVAKPDYSGQLVQGQSCRLENFEVRAEFTMTLPQLADGAKLSKDLSARWESFQDFVRRHEEGHRTIWLDTMHQAQTRISALRAPSCPQLQVQIDEAFQDEWLAGGRRQDAYDRAEQDKLVRHPLVQAAAAARRKMGAALAPQPAQWRPQTRLGGKAMN
jgi:predicted secreted Zn-dependent protease